MSLNYFAFILGLPVFFWSKRASMAEPNAIKIVHFTVVPVSLTLSLSNYPKWVYPLRPGNLSLSIASWTSILALNLAFGPVGASLKLKFGMCSVNSFLGWKSSSLFVRSGATSTSTALTGFSVPSKRKCHHRKVSVTCSSSSGMLLFPPTLQIYVLFFLSLIVWLVFWDLFILCDMGYCWFLVFFVSQWVNSIGTIRKKE